MQVRQQVADLSMRVYMLEVAVRQLQERASLEQKSRDWVNFACFRCHKKEGDNNRFSVGRFILYHLKRVIWRENVLYQNNKGRKPTFLLIFRVMPGSSKRAQKAELRALVQLMKNCSIKNRTYSKRERRRQDRATNACFFCHKQGHRVRSCPKRLKRFDNI